MIQLNTLNKTLFAALLALSSSQSVLAGSKLYQSDGKMPFVKMMLSMMSAMGMLDKVSGYGAPGFSSPGFGGPGFGGPGYGNADYGRYGGYGPYGYSSPQWGSYSNSPFQRSPWLQTPWSPSSISGVSPVWGSPDWGVLPTHEYSYGYSPYGYGYTPYGTRWSSADLEGWVNEPWGNSEWNPDAQSNTQELAQSPPPALQQQVQAPPQPVTPIVQNFNYNLYEDAQRGNAQDSERQDDGGQWFNQQAINRQDINRQDINRQSINRQDSAQQGSDQQGQPRPSQSRQAPGQYRQSPLAKLQQRQPERQAGGGPGRSSNEPLAPRQKYNKPVQYEKPCVTDFCGLKKPNLNGLWVAQDGEMLGIKNKRYLWSDGEKRYLSGLLKVQNEYLLASVEGSEKLMRFKYKLAGNNLLTMQPDGTIREFRRKPNNLYYGQYQGAYPDNDRVGN